MFGLAMTFSSSQDNGSSVERLLSEELWRYSLFGSGALDESPFSAESSNAARDRGRNSKNEKQDPTHGGDGYADQEDERQQRYEHPDRENRAGPESGAVGAGQLPYLVAASDDAPVP